MFKKIVITGAAAGLLLMSAVGAFAEDHHQSLPTQTITISNTGSVSNTVDTSANTGWNSLSGASVSGSSIVTGAASAGSNVQTQLNWNQASCGCLLGIGTGSNLSFSLVNNGTVGNTVSAEANTGYNSISAGGLQDLSFISNEGDHNHGMSNGISTSNITTGAANASSVVSSVVNTNMFGSPAL
jgi:hypothetical protein